MLANPLMWGMAVLALDCLRDREWIVHDVMNFYLLARWATIRHTSEAYFIDLLLIHQRLTSTPTAGEIEHFRHVYPTSHLPRKPVVFIVWHHEHYFTCVFDYNLQTAWLLGARRTRRGTFERRDVIWAGWSGDILWNYIAQIFEWHDVADEPNRIMGIDWYQVCHSA